MRPLVVCRAWPSQRSPTFQASSCARWRRPARLQGADSKGREGGESSHATSVALVSRLGEIDIGRLFWRKKRRHFMPSAARTVARAIGCGYFPLTFVGLAAHSTNLRSDQNTLGLGAIASRSVGRRKRRPLTFRPRCAAPKQPTVWWSWAWRSFFRPPDPQNVGWSPRCLHLWRRAGLTMMMGDPPRRFLTRSMRRICAPGARCDYLVHYDMNHTKLERRAAFLRKIEARFSNW